MKAAVWVASCGRNGRRFGLRFPRNNHCVGVGSWARTVREPCATRCPRDGCFGKAHCVLPCSRTRSYSLHRSPREEAFPARRVPSPRGNQVTADVSAHGPGNGGEAGRGGDPDMQRNQSRARRSAASLLLAAPTDDIGSYSAYTGSRWPETLSWKNEVVRRNTSAVSTRPPATVCEPCMTGKPRTRKSWMALWGFAFFVFLFCNNSFDEGRSGRDKVGHAGAAEAFPLWCSFWGTLPDT